MRYFASMIIVILLAVGALYAQGFGPGPGGMNQGGGNTVMVSTSKGLFALRNGVLARYNATTLKQEQVLQLFGPAPDRPTNTTDRTVMQKYYADMQQRLAPAIMLVQKDSLLVVQGDNFARINQTTLKPEAVAKLSSAAETNPPAPGNPGNMVNRLVEPAPSYLLVENTLYLMRSNELMAINTTDGKITRVDLPKELQPINPMRAGGNRPNAGGNRPNGGGGNRPNGGGG